MINYKSITHGMVKYNISWAKTKVMFNEMGLDEALISRMRNVYYRKKKANRDLSSNK